MTHLSHLHWEILASLDATNPSIKIDQIETKGISKTKFQLRDQHKGNYHQSQQSQLYWQRLKIGGKNGRPKFSKGQEENPTKAAMYTCFSPRTSK